MSPETERRLAELAAGLPPLSDEAIHQAAAILATARLRRADAA